MMVQRSCHPSPNAGARSIVCYRGLAMARSRSKQDRRRASTQRSTQRGKRRATKRREHAPAPRVERARPDVDAPLLALARRIAELHATDGVARLEAALERLAAGYGEDGTATTALFETWITSHRAEHREKTRELAVAWAREHIRLALQEILEQEVTAGRVRKDIDAQDLAWILLAGAEALAHEAPGDAPERIRLLLSLARGSS